MCIRHLRYFLLLVCVKLIVGCGGDNGNQAASISGINFQGGVALTIPFTSEERQYTLYAHAYAPSFSLALDLPEGITATAYAAEGEDDAEPSEISIVDDNTITFILGGAADHLLINLEGEGYEEASYVFHIVVEEFQQRLGQSMNFPRLLEGMIDTDDRPFGEIIVYRYEQYVIAMPEYDGEDADGNTVINSGAVFVVMPVYDGSGGLSWDIQLVQSPSPTAEDRFGTAIVYEGGLLFASAPNEDGDGDSTLEAPNDNLPNSGAVYGFLYDQEEGEWVARHYLKATNPEGSAFFGSDIDLWIDNGAVEDAELVAVEGNNYVAYVFKRNYTAATTDTPASDRYDNFATWIQSSAVSWVNLSSGFLAMGHLNNYFDADDDGDIDLNVGEVQLLQRQADGTFSDLTAVNTLSGTVENGLFGSSFAIDGNRVAIGAIGQGVGGQVQTFLFDEEASAWNEEQTIDGASNTIEGDNFGASVALHDTFLVIGATGNDGDGNTTIDTVIDTTADNHVNDSGAMYTYLGNFSSADQTDDYWEFDAYRKEYEPQADAEFGSDLTLSPAYGEVGVFDTTHYHVFY